jgi:protein O-mannosyl-transferase
VRHHYGPVSLVVSYRVHRFSISSAAHRQRIALYFGVIALALAASSTGFANGFALDDIALVADNARVHSLHRWWGLFALPYWPPQFGTSLYRPIVTLGYALQWTAGNGAPWVFHLTSILLYASVSALVLRLFLELLPPAAAFLGASLFAVHPVHVEAVANVVGQSELIAALAAIAASVIYVRGRRAGTLGAFAVAAIGLLFAVACLCKEHALLLPLLFLGLEWLVESSGAPQSNTSILDRLRAIAPLYVVLGAIGFVYLLVRTAVVGELLGEKHLVPVYGVQRLWVMLAVMPQWLRLLTWPAHLSADYSPQHIAVPNGIGPEVMVGMMILIVAGMAFVALGRGDANGRDARAAVRVGLAWTAVTLLPVSNLFSVMLVAERTLLMPSVGAMLVAAAATVAASRRLTMVHTAKAVTFAVPIVTTGFIVVGLVHSRDRQRVWRDDTTLFAQTVDDAPRSYRAQFLYGQLLFEQGKRAQGEQHLRLAIALNPTASDVSPLNYLATQYRDAGMCPQALPLYERAFANDATRPDVRYGLAACLLATGRVDDARRLAQDGVRKGDLKSLFLQLIAQTDSAASRRS